MKFGKQLELYELPEWRGHYIPYKALKKELDEIKDKGKTQAGIDAQEAWCKTVEQEAYRVGDFVDRGLKGLEQQLKDLGRVAESFRPRARSRSPATRESDDEGGQTDMELRVVEATGKVMEGLKRLRDFTDVNHAALYKILKKFDKQLGVKKGLAQIFPRLVDASRLRDTSRFDLLDDEVRRIALLSSQTEGLDAAPCVARLAAGLGHVDARAHEQHLLLAFFAGLVIAFFITIIILLALPAESPSTFSKSYFLTAIPVFRVVFSVSLILWCCGLVAWVCDSKDINHMFILRVDPRCRVTSEFFFTRAAGLTTFWVLIFGMYVLDYKWEVFPAVRAQDGYNSRSSVHFVIYPATLTVITMIGMFWPSRVCRNLYKYGVLRSLKRVVLAPRYPVDFADNLVGDVLTSLAKSLQDVPLAVCYLGGPHPQDERMVHAFKKHGNTCGSEFYNIISPLIIGLPYLFRAMQCLRRFRDSKWQDTKHLCNFGKYVSSLSVLIVSFLGKKWLLAVVLVSTISTTYNVIWDLTVDWGLGWHDFCGGRPRRATSDPFRPRSNSWQTDQTERVEVSARHFSASTYWLCSLFNVLARCTWVVTLMPASLVTQGIVDRVVLVSIISSTEIVRRCVWAVLRIEHEQVANASGFRALLWVPSKLNVEHDPEPRSSTNSFLQQPLLAVGTGRC